MFLSELFSTQTIPSHLKQDYDNMLHEGNIQRIEKMLHVKMHLVTQMVRELMKKKAHLNPT
jgi:Mn-dependent DtxR family transcriptional regulator